MIIHRVSGWTGFGTMCNTRQDVVSLQLPVSVSGLHFDFYKDFTKKKQTFLRSTGDWVLCRILSTKMKSGTPAARTCVSWSFQFLAAVPQPCVCVRSSYYYQPIEPQLWEIPTKTAVDDCSVRGLLKIRGKKRIRCLEIKTCKIK